MLGEALDEIGLPLEMLELKLLPSKLSAWEDEEEYVDMVLSDCSWLLAEEERGSTSAAAKLQRLEAIESKQGMVVWEPVRLQRTMRSKPCVLLLLEDRTTTIAGGGGESERGGEREDGAEGEEERGGRGEGERGAAEEGGGRGEQEKGAVAAQAQTEQSKRAHERAEGEHARADEEESGGGEEEEEEEEYEEHLGERWLVAGSEEEEEEEKGWRVGLPRWVFTTRASVSTCSVEWSGSGKVIVTGNARGGGGGEGCGRRRRRMNGRHGFSEKGMLVGSSSAVKNAVRTMLAGMGDSPVAAMLPSAVPSASTGHRIASPPPPPPPPPPSPPSSSPPSSSPPPSPPSSSPPPLPSSPPPPSSRSPSPSATMDSPPSLCGSASLCLPSFSTNGCCIVEYIPPQDKQVLRLWVAGSSSLLLCGSSFSSQDNLESEPSMSCVYRRSEYPHSFKTLHDGQGPPQSLLSSLISSVSRRLGGARFFNLDLVQRHATRDLFVVNCQPRLPLDLPPHVLRVWGRAAAGWLAATTPYLPPPATKVPAILQEGRFPTLSAMMECVVREGAGGRGLARSMQQAPRGQAGAGARSGGGGKEREPLIRGEDGKESVGEEGGRGGLKQRLRQFKAEIERGQVSVVDVAARIENLAQDVRSRRRMQGSRDEGKIADDVLALADQLRALSLPRTHPDS